MKMRKKGLSNAQNRTDSNHGARPARRVYRVLPNTICHPFACLHLHFYPASPDFRAGAYVHAIGFER